MLMKRELPRAALLALAFGIMACGTEDLAGPVSAPSVTGRWTYTANGLTAVFAGNPITCDYELVMDIPETGPTFEGFYSNARLMCTLTGSPQLVEFGGGDIVGGTLVGASVSFSFDSEAAHNTGTIMGDSMGGQVDIELIVQLDALIDTVHVKGAWTATR